MEQHFPVKKKNSFYFWVYWRHFSLDSNTLDLFISGSMPGIWALSSVKNFSFKETLSCKQSSIHVPSQMTNLNGLQMGLSLGVSLLLPGASACVTVQGGTALRITGKVWSGGVTNSSWILCWMPCAIALLCSRTPTQSWQIFNLFRGRFEVFGVAGKASRNTLSAKQPC